jgi:hypothetical protein
VLGTLEGHLVGIIPFELILILNELFASTVFSGRNPSAEFVKRELLDLYILFNLFGNWVLKV